MVVGGKGQIKTPTLAGRYADEFNVYPGPEETGARIAPGRNARLLLPGRDPDALLISSAGSVLVGTDEADYRERLAALAPRIGPTVRRSSKPTSTKRRTPRGTAEQVQRATGRDGVVGHHPLLPPDHVVRRPGEDRRRPSTSSGDE